MRSSRRKAAMPRRTPASTPATITSRRPIGPVESMMARTETGRGDRIGDEDTFFDCLRAEHAFDDLRRQMMAVDDETRREAIICELRPDVVFVPRQHRVRAITKMG